METSRTRPDTQSRLPGKNQLVGIERKTNMEIPMFHKRSVQAFPRPCWSTEATLNRTPLVFQPSSPVGESLIQQNNCRILVENVERYAQHHWRPTLPLIRIPDYSTTTPHPLRRSAPAKGAIKLGSTGPWMVGKTGKTESRIPKQLS